MRLELVNERAAAALTPCRARAVCARHGHRWEFGVHAAEAGRGWDIEPGLDLPATAELVDVAFTRGDGIPIWASSARLEVRWSTLPLAAA